MLTGLLRSKTVVSFVLAYLASAFLLLAQFFSWQLNRKGPSDLFFTHWAFGWLESSNMVLSVSCLVLAIGMLILGRLRFREVKTGLAESNLGMVAMASVIATQTRPLFTRPDVLLVGFVLLGLFMLMFSTYKRDSVLSEIFHVGLLLGCSALFVGQSILLLLAVGFALLILRTGNWKEWLVLFLGMVMTLVFVALFLVWNESPFLAFQRMIQTSWVGSLSTERFTLGHMLLAILAVVSVPNALRDLTAGTVHDRNVSLVNFGWIVAALLMVLILGLGWQAGLILSAFPLSTLISRNIESFSRWWLSDLLLILLIAAPFLRNLWQI